jgi:uncharacterized protein YcgL (UPF0745 family)
MTTEYLHESRRLVSVFRSPLREDMYLYVDRADALIRVPQTLQDLFGVPRHVMDLLLTPERTLARVAAADVLDGIRDRGFFLQMPPVIDDEMLAVIRANEKLAPGRRLA